MNSNKLKTDGLLKIWGEGKRQKATPEISLAQLRRLKEAAALARRGKKQRPWAENDKQQKLRDAARKLDEYRARRTTKIEGKRLAHKPAQSSEQQIRKHSKK